MRLQERAVRLAARALPAVRREVRREEWLADLHGSRELGINSWTVALGALRDAATLHNLRNHVRSASPRTWAALAFAMLGLVAVGVPGAALTSYMADRFQGVVTTETRADGDEILVHWREYPAIAGADTRLLLAGPTLEEGLEAGEAVIQDLRKEIAERVPVDWSRETDEAVLSPVENGYGGMSMLVAVNAPTWLGASGGVSADIVKDLVSAIDEVTGSHGFTGFRLDELMSADPDTTFVVGIATDAFGQWVAFTIGTPPGQASESGAEVSLAYGANGLLPGSQRAEFLAQVDPYLEFNQPEPRPS